MPKFLKYLEDGTLKIGVASFPVTSLIGSFQVFTSVYVMTVDGSTDVIVYHIYQAAWEQLRMGYASAMSWVLFIIIMVVTWLQFKVIGNEDNYD